MKHRAETALLNPYQLVPSLMPTIGLHYAIKLYDNWISLKTSTNKDSFVSLENSFVSLVNLGVQLLAATYFFDWQEKNNFKNAKSAITQRTTKHSLSRLASPFVYSGKDNHFTEDSTSS